MWVCVRGSACHVPVLCGRSRHIPLCDMAYVCICIYVCVTHIATSSSLWLRQVTFVMLFVTKNKRQLKIKREMPIKFLESEGHGV